MFKDILRDQQPVVYQTLGNALKKQQLSHCYLFSGPVGSLMVETATFFAQSIICSHKEDEWACEQCLECFQISSHEYVDLIYIDGSKETIKVESINALQSQFSQTALSMAGKKVFIINDCENMTAKAANSLLKFIEEPSNSTYGIFISAQVSRVLPTIVSRCQSLNFKPLSKDSFCQKAIEEGADELAAHLLSNLVSKMEDIGNIKELDSFQAAIRYFVEFMNLYFSDFKSAMLYLQDNGFKLTAKAKNPKKEREVFSYFLQIAAVFVNDYHNHITIEDESWDSLLKQAEKTSFNSRNFLEAVSETKDALIRATNQSLLTDQLLYKLSGGVYD